MKTSCAPTRTWSWVTSSAARSSRRGPRTRGSLPEGTTVVAMPLLRAGGGVHGIGLSAAAPGAYAEQILVQESLAIAGSQRTARAARDPHRADGRGLACRAPRRGQEAHRGDRHRLRPDRPVGDLHAQGERSADGDRERLLARAPRAGPRLRRRRGRRPGGRVALRLRRRARAPDDASCRARHGRRARWRNCSACRCPGTAFGAPPKPSARPPRRAR